MLGDLEDFVEFPWVGTINQRLNQPKCETSMKNRDSTNKNWELTIKIADLLMKKWEPTQLGTPLLVGGLDALEYNRKIVKGNMVIFI